MHIARIEGIEDKGSPYQVSFLKRTGDSSYVWPAEVEDKSSVDRFDIVALEKLTEEIVSGAGNTVRVKLVFKKSSTESAQKFLIIAPVNIR